MNWSTEKPTTPGWYWWRTTIEGLPTLIEITMDGDGVLRTGPPASAIQDGRLDETEGEWTQRVAMPS